MFDIKAKLTLKVVDNEKGWVGIIFRKKNDFNYYALDISKSWIRFRKMINGKQEVISKEAMTPNMLSNIWYNLELKVV